jgi:integrase
VSESAVKIAPNIYRLTRNGRDVGFRVYAWVHPAGSAKGKLQPKRFPPGTDLTTLKTWREEARVDARRAPVTTAPTASGFAADAARYLETVKAMPSIRERRQHIGEWIGLFGERPRTSVTSQEIRAQRDAWLMHGPKRVQRMVKGVRTWVSVQEPLSAGSVNRRLRALENLWTVLDGPAAPNPVRDVPECEEPAALPRGTTFEVLEEILRHMPEQRTRPTKGTKGSQAGPSKTLARLRVMMWTGLAHSQVAKLTAADVDLEAGTYYRPRRLKGRKGARNRTATTERPRPLLPHAVEALRHFFAIGADGPFSRSSLHKSWRRALAAANRARKAEKRPLIPVTLRPYDVKHSFGAEAYRMTGNIRAVQELLGLSRIELADRYAHTAIAPVAAAAAVTMAQALEGRKSGANLPAVLPAPRKVRKRS